MNRRAAGSKGEEIAAAYLTARGAEILARNFHRQSGEIDLIVRIDGVVAFVEVKMRASDRYGTPGEAVNRKKQRRIVQTALHFIQEHALEEEKLRFDVVEITPERVRHIPNAFDVLSATDA